MSNRYVTNNKITPQIVQKLPVFRSIPAFSHSLVTIEQQEDVLTISVYADYEDTVPVSVTVITKDMLSC